jgi:5-methylcytosine-specific restriction protein A
MESPEAIPVIGAIKKMLGIAPADPAALGHARDPHWPAASGAFLKGKSCAGCGRKDKLATHHVKPFHIFPDLEMSPTNWIALCEAGQGCHFAIGHCGDWKAFNPEVREDAAHHLVAVTQRRYVA